MRNALLASTAVMTAKAKSGNTPGFADAHPGYTVAAGKLTMKRQNVKWMLCATNVLAFIKEARQRA